MNEKLRVKAELEKAKQDVREEEEWKQRELVEQKKARAKDQAHIRVSRKDGKCTCSTDILS